MGRTGRERSRIRIIQYLFGLLLWSATIPAVAQSLLLHDVRILSSQVGLEIVPGHGDQGVAWRDYRNMTFTIQRYDFSSAVDQRLATLFYAEPGVTTSGSRTAWIGYTQLGQADVYVHDSAGGGIRRITNDAFFQNHPHLHGDRLVWQDYRHAPVGEAAADIYLHDFTTGNSRRLTSGNAYRDHPRIYGDTVVWQDYRHAGPELETAEMYVYSLSTGIERRLTFGSTYRTHPAIAGDLIVWEDYRNSERGDIYLYDLARGTEVEISTYPAHKTLPSVYGEWVLWLDYRAGTSLGDIYGYNLRTGQEYALVVHPDHQEPAHIYGTRIVWQDYRDGRIDLYAAELLDPAGTDVEDVVEGVAGLRMMAAPNPFVFDVRLVREGGVTAPEGVAIYDLMGRMVWEGGWSAAETSILWDGRDEAGRRVPAGVYLAASGGNSARRVLIVRL
jgi:TolB protein